MLEQIKNDNKDFFKLRGQQSEVFNGCNVAQEITIKHLLEGKSYSYIAKNIFNIHYTTLMNNCKSIAFISALGQANDSVETITLELCRKKLTEIIRTSNNENAILKAIQIMQNFGTSVKIEEIANAVKVQNDNKEEAQAILDRLGISTDNVIK